MLRDLVAALVVARAERLAGLERPGEGFDAVPIELGVGGKRRKVHRLSSELTGFEMVLACATNAAAENVSAEIPLAGAIAPEWRGRIDYFTGVATSVLNGKRAAGSEEEPAQAWALVAACLGSVGRCKAFATAFWFGQVPDGRGLLQILKDHKAESGDWEDAVADFRAVRERAGAGRELREEYGRLFTGREYAWGEGEQHASRLRAAAVELQSAQCELDDREQELARCGGASKRCVEEQAKHREVRPRALEMLFHRRTTREWRERDGQLTELTAAAERALADATERHARAGAAVATCAERVREHEVGEREARERAAEFQEQIVADGERWAALLPGVVFPDGRWEEESERARRELRAPWVGEVWDQARSELFLAALELHKAFVLASAGKLRRPVVGQARRPVVGVRALSLLFCLPEPFSGCWVGLGGSYLTFFVWGVTLEGRRVSQGWVAGANIGSGWGRALVARHQRKRVLWRGSRVESNVGEWSTREVV